MLDEWQRFLDFPDTSTAVAAAAYLEQNGVPSRVEASPPGVDFSSAAFVWVPSPLAHRARWLWAQSDLSEAELRFLATGDLDGG